MIKKFVLLSAVSLCSCLAEPTTSIKPFSGPYVGIGAGFSQMNVERNERMIPQEVYSLSIFADNKTSKSIKPVFSIHGGYDHQLKNDLVFGAELSLDALFHNDTFNTALANTSRGLNATHFHSSTIKNNFAVRLLLKGGKAFGKHLIYGAVGPIINRYDIENVNSLTSGDESYTLSEKRVVYKMRCAFGIGYTYKIKKIRFGVVVFYQPKTGLGKKEYITSTPSAADPLFLNTNNKASKTSVLFQVGLKL